MATLKCNRVKGFLSPTASALVQCGRPAEYVVTKDSVPIGLSCAACVHESAGLGFIFTLLTPFSPLAPVQPVPALASIGVELARRLPALQQDSAENNAHLITNLLRQAMARGGLTT